MAGGASARFRVLETEALVHANTPVVQRLPGEPNRTGGLTPEGPRGRARPIFSRPKPRDASELDAEERTPPHREGAAVARSETNPAAGRRSAARAGGSPPGAPPGAPRGKGKRVAEAPSRAADRGRPRPVFRREGKVSTP